MSIRVHQSLVTTTAALTTRATLAGLVTVAVLAAVPADAGPNGGTVVGGSATIQGQGTGAVTINQATQNAIINWNTFNIGRGETTTFNQPNSASNALNRVIGGHGPSFLDGTLTANGHVFIVNGDGILFGSNAVINTAGFLATTSDIRNEDFMAGKYNFNIPGLPNASIVNQGTITATSGGFAALVAPGVRNSGTITATLGTVSLAAGNAFTLDFYGDRLITLAVNDQIAGAVKDVQTGQTLKSLVHNTGKLSANGGRVELTAAAARAVVDSVINNKGVIEANSIGTRNGMIVLGAATGASKPAGAPPQTVKLAGQISAAGKDKGTKGGTVLVTGENIVLAGAAIDASGDAGGGKVLIGGDTGGGKPSASAATIELAKLESFSIPTATTVSVDAASIINTSATGQGNGGKVVIWSDQQTTFAGTILAQGGATGGNGGFVETSGHTLDFTGGRVNTSAPMGKTGNWLLDPTNLTIDVSAASTISSNLATTNVTVQTNADGSTSGPGTQGSGPGDIIVNANIAWASANALELSAFHSILITDNGKINSAGGGNLTLRADNTGSDNHGTVSFTGDGTGHINISNGGSLTVFYNPASFPVPDFQFNKVTMTGSGNLTAYVLVNTPTELQNIDLRLQGTYALGRDIDASSLTSFVPIGTISSGFTGILEAQNHAIQNLTINSSAQLVGLFGYIGSSGVVRNLNLQNVKVTATSTGGSQTVGLVAGQNDGSIVNVSTIAGSTNSVTGILQAGITAGGLVGLNTHSISNANVRVQVTVADGGTEGNFNYAGGLAGINTGTINSSTAMGAVTGGSNAFVGGLVGQDGNTGQPGGAGFIGSSSASGAVSLTENAKGSSVGGLVGYIAAGASVNGSNASGTVSGDGFIGGLAGQNLGAITFSSATGNVSGGAGSTVGGLVGQNGSFCGNDCSATGTIDTSFATGAVTTGGVGGGLIGINSLGSVTQSYATGAVSGSANVQLGGLVGFNDIGATITDSHASGNVSAGGNSSIGGLVGSNLGSVTQSHATGAVSGSGGGQVGGLVGINLGSVTQSDATGAVSGSGQVGGLVGINLGSVTQSHATGTISGDGALGGLVGVNGVGATITTSSASGAVSGNGELGGFAGENLGTISNSSATGAVSGFGTLGGLIGLNNGAVSLSFAMGTVSALGNGGPTGGLVGWNFNGGVVQSSFATGAVSGSGNAQIGGLVGINDTGATITSSYATGNVTGTNLVAGNGAQSDIAAVGGFAGKNDGTITNSHATGNVSVAGTGSNFGDFAGGGFVGVNNSSGVIQGLGQFTYATGSATGGAQSVVGGFAGINKGLITFANASGTVQVGSDSYAGGFGAGNIGTIFQAFATGAVTDDGNTVLGGFGAFNIGSLSQVFATGAVTGGTNTVVAGLVAVNAALQPSDKFGSPVGSITDSYATGAASGGAGSIVAGLVAVNDGKIATSYSAGAVSGGTVGGLVAKHNSSFQFADLSIPSIVDQGGAPIPLKPGSGTITNSYWNTETSGQSSSAGGTGMTSVQLASGLPPGFDPNVWTILPDPSFPYFPWAPFSTIPNVVLPINTPNPPTNPPPNPPPNPPSQPQIIDNLTGGLTLVSLPPPVTVLPYPQPPAPGPQQPVGEPRLFAVPPAGETRYRTDEALLMADCDASQSALDAVAREMRLTIMESQCLTQTHKKLLRMHIDSGQTVTQVIRAMARYRVFVLAQANFVYRLMQDRVAQDLAQDPDLAGRTQEGDSAQYALGKLGVIDIHRLIKGTNIPIAVIDSQIDVKHPDLDGVFADQYDAVGGAAEQPHPHGTGMAGAIAAHRKLMGIAPAARIYAIHAFSSNAASADSTTFNILKGLDWAASKGVRIINMSFAGPRDPSMERALKLAHDKGIVLIAAAGNAGPKSPPLYPGADPSVIAVTATDSNDKLFAGANRGRYIAVAAPGVDILVPAPDDTYQLTTGTSVSSAEVSGIVALMLERNPNLTPEDIRKILTSSAKRQGAKDRDDDFGSGLVDPSKAIQSAGELKPVGQPAKR
jgi:filamentous hemagglutinin family protein